MILQNGTFFNGILVIPYFRHKLDFKEYVSILKIYSHFQ